MGACCSVNYLTKSEKYIYENLFSLNIWQISYEELIKELKSKWDPVKRITKEKIRTLKCFQYMSEIQEYFLTRILATIKNDTFSIYEICFRLFSFLSLGDHAGDYFYDICVGLNNDVSIKLSEYGIKLKEFFHFSLIETNHFIIDYIQTKNIEDKDNIIEDLRTTEKKYFQDHLIEERVDDFIKSLNEFKDINTDQVKKSSSEKLYFNNFETRSYFQLF